MSNNTSNTQKSPRKPVVLMSMGAQERGGHDYQVMTKKYMAPLVEISGCIPVLAPTCFSFDSADLDQYLDMVDGVYVSGASTNMDPALYGQENLTPHKTQDKGRDLFDLPLIRKALERGLPLFGVCRGMQELNVEYGGNLHQKAYELEGYNDHREDADAPWNEQYNDQHPVHLVPDTWFHQLIGKDEFPVNSLHGQALDKLGEGIEVLARGDDGLVEAVHSTKYPQFSLAVQWHPEWKASENPVSVKIFQAFGDACRKRVAETSK